jgi:hypothetical protein
VGKGVRAVDEHVHAARVRHVRDLPHRQDVSGDVDHVRHHQQPRPRSDGLRIHAHDLIVCARMRRHAHESIDHAVATGDEAELREHVAVVLFGLDGLVTRLPVVAVDDGGDRFGGVAGDAELRRRASRKRCELVPRRRLVRHLRRPQVVGCLVIDRANLVDEGLQHRRGLHAVVAALEVDVVRLEPVLGSNGRPERLVLSQSTDLDLGVSRPDAVAEQEAEAGRARGPQELALVHRYPHSTATRRRLLPALVDITVGPPSARRCCSGHW